MENQNELIKYEPIVLDKWDSQVFYLAKGWFDENIKLYTNFMFIYPKTWYIEALRWLYSKRTVLQRQHISDQHLLSYLLSILHKMNFFCTYSKYNDKVKEIFEEIHKKLTHPFFKEEYHDYMHCAISIILNNYIANTQILDIEDDKSRVLVEMKERDKSLFKDYFKGEDYFVNVEKNV